MVILRLWNPTIIFYVFVDEGHRCILIASSLSGVICVTKRLWNTLTIVRRCPNNNSKTRVLEHRCASYSLIFLNVFIYVPKKKKKKKILPLFLQRQLLFRNAGWRSGIKKWKPWRGNRDDFWYAGQIEPRSGNGSVIKVKLIAERAQASMQNAPVPLWHALLSISYNQNASGAHLCKYKKKKHVQCLLSGALQFFTRFVVWSFCLSRFSHAR